MIMNINLPKPDDLLERPHLAVLFLLVASASASLRAMGGLHPEVYHGSFPRKITELDHCAGRLMDLCGQIQEEVQKYHSLMNEPGSLFPSNRSA